MVALGISRAQNTGAAPVSPLQTLNDFAQLQGRLLQNRQTAQKLQAYQSVGQDIATGGDVMRNPGIAYLPEVGNMIVNRDQALVNMAHVRAEMTDEASTALGKDMIQLALDPNPSMERWNAIVQAHAEGLTDPLSRATYLARAQDQGRSMLDGMPTPEEMQANPAVAQQARDRLRNNIMGQVIGSVGSWDAMQSGLTGGPMLMTSKDVPYIRPLGQPGALVPVTPGGGTPIAGIPPQTTMPVGTAPGEGGGGAAPVAVSPNALAPPVPDTGNAATYGPGAVTAQPLGPMPSPTAAPAPAAAPVPVAGGGGAAAGGGGVTPPAAPAAAPVAGAPQGGGGPVTLPSGVTLYQNQRATAQGIPISSADGSPLWTGSLGGRGPQPVGFNLNHDPLWGGQESRVRQSQETFDKEIEPKFDDAQQIVQQTAAVRDAYNTLQRAGGWTSPGVGLGARIDLINKINVLKNLMHLPGDDLPETASYQDLQKLQTRMGFAVAEQLGHREAFQTIRAATSAVPGTEATFTGGQMINRMIEAQAQRDIEQYQYWSAYGSANYGSFAGANEQFMRDHPPTAVPGKVLQEFGLGPTGFAGATSQQTNDNIWNAYKNGYITRDQAKNLYAGRGANQPEQQLPGGGVYSPIRPGPPRAE